MVRLHLAERVQVMSLSDHTLDNNHEDSSGWKPLIPSKLEKVDEEEGVFPKLAEEKKEEEFKQIYNNKKNKEEIDDFTLIYSKEEENAAISKVRSEVSDTLTEKNKDQAGDAGKLIGDKQEEEPVSLETPPQDVNAIEKDAYEKGFANGEKEGLESGKKEAERIVTQLNGILSEIQHLWQNMVEKYEKEILELVCHAVEKVLYGQVAIDNAIVKKAILYAFEKIPEPVDVTININPEDYDYIEMIKEEILEQVKELQNVIVVSNPAVDRGGCKVETKSGEVDTSVFDRLEAIKKSIIEAGGSKA